MAVQLIGYEPSGVGSSLLVSDAGTVCRVSLEAGRTLEFALGERRCAGTVDLDSGTHTPCERPSAPFCDQHTSTWICARCTGTCLKVELDCDEPHAVYLAGFAPETVKVGVTREWRLETRLREQGADRGVHVTTVEDGRIARELEADLATRFPDRVSISTKRAGLTTAMDEAVWEAALETVEERERYLFTYGLDLSHQPVAESIARGTVRGLKGRLLVLESVGTTYAVDLRDLVGYTVASGPSSRRRQSSLGVFDEG